MQAIKQTVAAAAVLTLAASLAGCLHGHHAEQVVYKPMKLGAADAVPEQAVRGS